MVVRSSREGYPEQNVALYHLGMVPGFLDFKGKEGDNYYNGRFRWQRPLWKSIFVLFCCGIRRVEEKETQNINVVG